MKELLRKIFSPLLNPLERGDQPYAYKSTNRKILIAVSILFYIMSAVVLWLMPANADKGYFLPVTIFALVAIITTVVGLLGNDRAVAKLWGSH